MKISRVNLLNLDRHDMESFFADIGEKSFRASQVLQWIHQYGVSDFDAMTNISRALRGRLNDIAYIQAPRVVRDQLAVDGTRKWLLQLDCGNCIETVFIPEPGRGTLCISSQAGCALNCSICATAQQGFNRNLTMAEIIAQLWVANRALGRDPKGERIISNAVFMGMGEPLLNFDNVVKAIGVMRDDFAYGLSKRRITLSTAGVVPAIDRLGQCESVGTDHPVNPGYGVNLAVSLHATNDSLRSEIIPLNKNWPIKELIGACVRYVRMVRDIPGGRGKSRVTFQYVMLAGVNDSLHQAHELARILAGVPAKINLIPFNPFPGSIFQCSSPTVIDRFREILMRKEIITVTRRSRGEDIGAACGQLAGRVVDRTRRQAHYKVIHSSARQCSI